MRAVFTLTIFVIFLIIAILLLNFILSSLFGISFFGGRGGGGTRRGGILVSQDKGGSWEFKNQVSEKKNISRVEITDIAFDPQKPTEVIYLGTQDNGLFKSTDGANTWNKIEDKNKVLGSRASVYEITIDPQSTSNIFLAVFEKEIGRVLKSGDGGESFEELYVVSSPKESVSGVVIDWYDPSIIFATTSSGLFLRSKDQGVSWEKIEEFQGPISKIYMNPHDSRQIYITTSDPQKLFKTSDKGETWQDLTSGLEKFAGASNIINLLIDPPSISTLYLATEFGLLKSQDGGVTFSEVKTIIPRESLPVLTVGIDSRDSNTIYLTAKNQFYKSGDGGINWQVKNLPTSMDAKILMVNPANPDTLYIGLGTVKIRKKGPLF